MAGLTGSPKITVLLPVYNAGEYLQESVNSILEQTFQDFELVIINDGSTDNSQQVIESFHDPRIRAFRQENAGLARTLNRGIELAKGSWIARQDNDDISAPTRLEKQIQYLELHPDIALLGTAARIVDKNGRPTGRFHRHPTSTNELRFSLLFDNPFVHSSVMMKRQAVLEVGGYDPNPLFFEDFNLWSRIARNYKVANLPEVLVDYREVHTGMSKSASDYARRVQRQSSVNIRHYLPQTTEQISADLTEGRLSLRETKRLMSALMKTVSEDELIDEPGMNELFERNIQEISRKRLNRIIDSDEFNSLQKLFARIRRRFLIQKMERV